VPPVSCPLSCPPERRWSTLRCSRRPSNLGCYDRRVDPSIPERWTWELSFVGHAEMRMEQRGVTEVDVRSTVERASGFEPNAIVGPYVIKTRQHGRPRIVIVEPEVEANLLVVVTVYEVE
jgi:uncharacterized protein DUF4258